MIPSTADLQTLTRPVIEQVFAQLGHTITVFPAAGRTGPGPGDVDRNGNPVSSPSNPPTLPAGTAYPGYAYQVPASKRGSYGALGADLAQPLWEVLIRYDAPLDTPGFSLSAQGVGLPDPVALKPIQDADNLGAQRVAWMILCHATRALEG